MKDPDWPTGYAKRVLDEVDSTNAEGLRMAPGLAGPTWIFARRQIAGRGRRGRAWTDPAGNFAASLVLRPAEPPAQAALRSFVAALALHDALSALVPRADLSLKWPNDVLLSGCKLAGILLEGAGSGRVMDHLVIGIGVNLAAAPPGAEGAVPPISLVEGTSAEVAPETLLAHLGAAYAAREAVFAARGFGPVREAWLARAARLGEEVIARTMQGETRGLFETVDQDGHLVLKAEGGRVAIPAADVFFERGT